jgi:hypothetical protein
MSQLRMSSPEGCPSQALADLDGGRRLYRVAQAMLITSCLRSKPAFVALVFGRWAYYFRPPSHSEPRQPRRNSWPASTPSRSSPQRPLHRPWLQVNLNVDF